MPDLTDDELLEQLSAKPDCGCLTCRMVHEIQRRRAAHEAGRIMVNRLEEALGALDSRIAMIEPEIREAVRCFRGAEAK